jgi:serine protease AprX
MLTADPSLTPDQVKSRLLESARPIAETSELAAGKGIVDAYGAVHCGGCADVDQGVPAANGLGLLDADRGSVDVFIQTTLQDPTEVPSVGEFAALLDPLPGPLPPLGNPGELLPWLSAGFATTEWTPETWNASSWKNRDWAGTAWEASSWKATEWDASSWKGTEWDNADWDASSWKGTDWDASSWKASSWKSSWYAAGWD